MELFQGQVLTWRSLALVVTTLVVVAIFHNVCSLIMYFWWTPRRLRHIMEKQGWKGPKTFHILAGNMHEIIKFRDEESLKDLAVRNFDIGSRILPQYVLYSQKYGTSTTPCYL
jgi:cytokinin trans-hydroxylase